MLAASKRLETNSKLAIISSILRESFCYDIGLLGITSTKPYIDLVASWTKSDIILYIDNTLSSSICQAQKIVSVRVTLSGSNILRSMVPELSYDVVIAMDL
jgi:hypothetical protein